MEVILIKVPLLAAYKIIVSNRLLLFPHHFALHVLTRRRAELFPPLRQDHKKSSSTCKEERRKEGGWKTPLSVPLSLQPPLEQGKEGGGRALISV